MGAPITELMDGVVDQVLEIGACVRRGRVLAGSEGIFTVSLQCNHAGADTQTVAINPYELGSTGLIAPMPSPMPVGFDIWLLYVTGVQSVGSSTVAVVLRIMYPAAQQGFGIDEAGAAVVIDADMPVCRFDAALANTGSFMIQESGEPIARVNIRLPRSPDLQLQMSSISSGATLHTLHMTFGVFPTALGQDAVI